MKVCNRCHGEKFVNVTLKDLSGKNSHGMGNTHLIGCPECNCTGYIMDAPPTRNDCIRKAISVMAGTDHIGGALGQILRNVVPAVGLSGVPEAEQESMMKEVKLTIQSMKSSLTRLSTELKEIDN